MGSSSTRAAAAALANRRLLIIDDMADIHAAMDRCLSAPPVEVAQARLLELSRSVLGESAAAVLPAQERMTFELVHAYHGREGLEKLQQARAEKRPFAGAFVDMRMPPGWNGLETAVHLLKEDPRLGIVFCTAYSDHQASDIADKLGGRDRFLFLYKPFASDEVEQLAYTMCERWTRRTTGQVVYTVREEQGSLAVVAREPDRITDRAMVFDDPVVLPDGQERRVLRPGIDVIPSTPREALRAYLDAQMVQVDHLRTELAVTEGRIRQVRDELARLSSSGNAGPSPV